jgi:hypothetical protein
MIGDKLWSTGEQTKKPDLYQAFFVENIGVEPMTSCMPCSIF